MLKSILRLLPVFLFVSTALPGQTRKIQKLDGSYSTALEVDQVTKRLMDAAQVTGLGISILNKNEVVYQQAFGYSNFDTKDTLSPNTIFYGASLSKAVFAVLVMQLVEEGVINLDTPLQQYLPKQLPDYKFKKSWRGYQDLKGDDRYKAITARMCLAHTTGFPNWRFLTDKGLDAKGKLYLQFDPGTRYSYSGEGLSLLQFVLEQITGKGLEEMAQQRIFKPLGMTRTSYIYVWQPGQEKQYAYGHDSKQGVLPKDEADDAGAAGSMGTTLADYTTFLTALLNQKLLKKASMKELFTQQVAINSKRQFGPQAQIETDENRGIDLGYGLGWGVLQTPYGVGAFKEGHAEGYQHYSILFPEAGTGVLILTNSDNGESIFKELLEKTIGDTFTPWQWENYIPYDVKK